MLFDDYKSLLGSDIDSESEAQEITSKEFFFTNFDLLPSSDLDTADLYCFDEFSFYPIVNRSTKLISVLTINKNLRRDLGKLADKRPLKILSKYAKNLNFINYTANTLYFEIIDKTSVLDKEYSNDEAKDFFNDLLTDASRKNSSDIHIRWLSDSVEISYRLDGKIIKQPKKITKDLGKALRNIFLNKSGESEYEENEISGHIAEIVDNVKKEYRISIGPTVHGYNIVIRTESTINKDTTLDQWGYSPKAIKMIRELFNSHNGIILVTGATGSGKSTLLYTCIIEKINENPIYSPEILTVEDPVEIVIDGVNQVQVNTKGDKKNWITFTSAIKMFLRQDPDMIVVGEIRDYDVAIQAVTAAKTGHLTASTLHTNDVKSTFSRLRELGIDNANIEDGVKGVISQKLLNRLCSYCKIKVEKSGQVYFERNREGCQECGGSSVKGCKGRVPIVEIAELNHNPENYKPENFEDYYALDENIIYLLEEGIIDHEEAERFMHVIDQDNLSTRKYILDLWNKATKSKSEQKYIFPLYQPIIDDKDYIIGFESFMRMKDENGDIIGPAHFLESIKQMEIYQKVSMFILDQLIKTAKKIEKKIFWNIDEDNIKDESFADSVLSKLEQNDVLNKIVLEFTFKPEFKTEYKKFILFCNKNKISISLDHFEGNMTDIIFMEREGLIVNYVKTSKDFVDGLDSKEKWLDDYLSLIIHHDAQIIVNFIETEAMWKEVLKVYGSKIYGYQGYGFRRPDFIENYLKK